MRRRFAVLTLCALVIVSSAAVGFFILGERGSHNDGEPGYPLADHSPITVAADEEFTAPGTGSGCECVRSGSGKEGDPYVISDWIVNATGKDGFVMFATTAYFVVSRIMLKGDSANRGMYMEQVENGAVEHSQITGWSVGAYIFRSSNLEFLNNTITGNQYGIQLEASANNRLIGNRFDENEQIGIFVRGSENFLKDNSAARNGFGGINVDATGPPANRNHLEGNAVSDNGVYGVGVWRSAESVLKSNVVTGNKIVGIMLTDHCTGNLIESNRVLNNSGGGILLTDGSSGNTIRGNTARGNGDGVEDFDLFDNGRDNIWQNNTYGTKKPDNLG